MYNYLLYTLFMGNCRLEGDKMNMNIGENIKILRMSANMTQGDLADKLRVTVSSISAYENGVRMPSYDTLIKIARLYNVTTDNLLGFSTEYVADVSGLNAEQRKVIFELIELYRLKNDKDNHIRVDENTNNAIKTYTVKASDVYQVEIKGN